FGEVIEANALMVHAPIAGFLPGDLLLLEGVGTAATPTLSVQLGDGRAFVFIQENRPRHRISSRRQRAPALPVPAAGSENAVRAPRRDQPRVTGFPGRKAARSRAAAISPPGRSRKKTRAGQTGGPALPPLRQESQWRGLASGDVFQMRSNAQPLKARCVYNRPAA